MFDSSEAQAGLARPPESLPEKKNASRKTNNSTAPIEIVDFPMKNGNFPQFFECLPEDDWLVVSNILKNMKVNGKDYPT